MAGRPPPEPSEETGLRLISPQFTLRTPRIGGLHECPHEIGARWKRFNQLLKKDFPLCCYSRSDFVENVVVTASYIKRRRRQSNVVKPLYLIAFPLYHADNG